MSAPTVPLSGAATAVDQVDATYSKISWRLLPFLGVLWVLAWLDRVNIGFAKLQMLDDLRFSEAVYGLGAGIFFLGYFLFEVPSNMLLQKIGAKKTVMRITIGWGLICMLQAWVSTPTQFYILRLNLASRVAQAHATRDASFLGSCHVLRSPARSQLM
jgi:MFS family permease